jgi:hypothetical protein
VALKVIEALSEIEAKLAAVDVLHFADYTARSPRKEEGENLSILPFFRITRRYNRRYIILLVWL